MSLSVLPFPAPVLGCKQLANALESMVSGVTTGDRARIPSESPGEDVTMMSDFRRQSV
jgi:hypothetical protein